VDRNDTLRAISSLVRRDQWAAVFTVGYLAADASTETLSALLTALREAPGPTDRPDHLAAYGERWDGSSRLG